MQKRSHAFCYRPETPIKVQCSSTCLQTLQFHRKVHQLFSSEHQAYVRMLKTFQLKFMNMIPISRPNLNVASKMTQFKNYSHNFSTPIFWWENWKKQCESYVSKYSMCTISWWGIKWCENNFSSSVETLCIICIFQLHQIFCGFLNQQFY
jgi:hypothetical protein